MTLHKLVYSASALSVLGEGRIRPISIATIYPAFTDKFVTAPKVPTILGGTVSSTILGKATVLIPPHIPKISLPMQIRIMFLNKVIVTAPTPIQLKMIMTFLLPNYISFPPEIEPMAVPSMIEEPIKEL